MKLIYTETSYLQQGTKRKAKLYPSMNYSLSKKHLSFGRKLHIRQQKQCETGGSHAGFSVDS
jgi:hypothetical protein